MKSFKEFSKGSSTKKHWYIYRVSDKHIVTSAFESEGEANDALMDIDSDDYEVGLGHQVGLLFKP